MLTRTHGSRVLRPRSLKRRQLWRSVAIALIAGLGLIGLLPNATPCPGHLCRASGFAGWAKWLTTESAYGWEAGGSDAQAIAPDPLPQEVEAKLSELSDLREEIGRAYDPAVDWQRPAAPASFPWHSIPLPTDSGDDNWLF